MFPLSSLTRRWTGLLIGLALLLVLIISKHLKRKYTKIVSDMVKEAEKLLKERANAAHGSEAGGSWPTCFKSAPSRLRRIISCFIARTAAVEA